MSVRICFDQQIFRLLAKGGISRSFADLIDGLPAAGLDVRLPFRLHGNAHLHGPGLIRLPIQLFQLLRRLGIDPSTAMACAAHGSTAAGQACLLHATYYLGPPPQQLPCPLVSTLHDMIPELLSEQAPLGRGADRVHKLAWLEASTAIVSVSASSAAALISLAPHLAARITVIHHGTRFLGLRPRPCSRMPRQPFLLAVGRRGGYKNTDLLFELLPQLPQSLVLAGGGPLRRHERERLRRHGLVDRVHVLNPDDAQLAWLYRHCSAVLVPSLAEGFSLPLIEALACDAPVVASDLPVHGEIGGRFATLCDPRDAVAWRRVLAGPRLPPRPSQRLSPGQAAALQRHYSLPRMLADYRAFYRSLL